MKTMFKVFWPVTALLVLNACQKETELLSPVVPDPVIVPVITEKNALVISSDNTGSFYSNYALTGALKWNYNTSGMSAFVPAAVNSDYTVFADPVSSVVYCMDTRSGEIIWEKGGIHFSSFMAPLLVKGLLFISNNDHMQVYDPQTGDLVNEFPVLPYPHSLNYVDGLLIYGNCGGHLMAINTNGEQQWEYQSPGGCYHNNPAIANNAIYILSSSGYLSAISIETGIELWSKDIATYTFEASLIYNGGLLFAIDHKQSDKIFAFSVSTGDLVHTYQLPDGESCNMFITPAAKGDHLYFLTEEGTLVAYSIEDEMILWQKQFGVEGRRINVPVKNAKGIEKTEAHSDMTSVVLANDWLYFGAGKFIYAVDINSTTYWQAPLNGFIINSPVILTDRGNVFRAGNAGVVLK